MHCLLDQFKDELRSLVSSTLDEVSASASAYEGAADSEGLGGLSKGLSSQMLPTLPTRMDAQACFAERSSARVDATQTTMLSIIGDMRGARAVQLITDLQDSMGKAVEQSHEAFKVGYDNVFNKWIVVRRQAAEQRVDASLSGIADELVGTHASIGE